MFYSSTTTHKKSLRYLLVSLLVGLACVTRCSATSSNETQPNVKLTVSHLWRITHPKTDETRFSLSKITDDDSYMEKTGERINGNLPGEVAVALEKFPKASSSTCTKIQAMTFYNPDTHDNVTLCLLFSDKRCEGFYQLLSGNNDPTLAKINTSWWLPAFRKAETSKIVPSVRGQYCLLEQTKDGRSQKWGDWCFFKVDLVNHAIKIHTSNVYWWYCCAFLVAGTTLAIGFGVWLDHMGIKLPIKNKFVSLLLRMPYSNAVMA